MLDQLLAHWPLKVLALFLAFLIWATIAGEKRLVQDFNIPLDIRLPQTRTLDADPPKTVTIRLRGTESVIRGMDKQAMEVAVNLQDSALGARNVQLTSADVSGLPTGAEVDFIDPDRLDLVVVRRSRRELAVEPTFIGQPPEGFAFYGAEIQPATVTIEGPTSEVDPLVIVKTNPIRLDQRRQPFSVRVAAVPEGPNVRVAEPRPLEVGVIIDAAPVDRRYESLPVTALGASFETSIVPNASEVVLSGPPSLLDALRRDQIRLTADLSSMQPTNDAQQVPLKLDLINVPREVNARLSVKTISPRSVTVRMIESKVAL